MLLEVGVKDEGDAVLPEDALHLLAEVLDDVARVVL